MTTLSQLSEVIKAELEASYDLAYVDYRDRLTVDQVAMLARGDMEALWDDTAEWESDSQWSGACFVVDELATFAARSEGYEDLLREFGTSDERDELIDMVRERDSGMWLKTLVNQTPPVMLRINVIDEDNSYQFEEVSPERLLSDVGLPETPKNLELAASIIDNSSPEYGVKMAYWLATVRPSDIFDLPGDPEAALEIINPSLYLCNPFVGDGMADGPFDGVVTVKRGDLRTDKDAFGYGWEEVSGCYISAYEAKIRAKA